MPRRLFLFPTLTGVFITVFGAAFLALGGWLLALGGSPYYVVAGTLLVVSGVLMIMGREGSLWWYFALFIGTLAWSLFEVGLDGWKLMPRIFLFAVLGIWCSLPMVVRPLTARHAARISASVAGVIYALSIIGIFWSGFAVTDARHVQYEALSDLRTNSALPAVDTVDTDWRYYGHTMAGTRYSPLSQITGTNVKRLRKAWQYETGDLPRKGETTAGREFNFEATPIKVGNRLYLCTPHRHVIALDATTGKPIWTFDPHAQTAANEYLACRGVAYYEAPPGSDCPRRIIATTADARIVALDAETGKPCEGFGEHGFVSLTEHMGKVPPGFLFITSQPLVVRDRIILGGWIYDEQAEGEPSGVVRAYDPLTGKPAWAWDMGKPDPTAPLRPGEIYTRGTPNGWGTYTADAELGLVYVPLGNATPDYYGANRRPFDDKYSSAVVALDIETGNERWHFQTVHHDLWDFDLPIGPTLVDLPGPNGSTVPALVQTTKMGEFFLLDRRTGKPLANVVEKPVPTSPALPGERPSPTQPYSVGMPTLAPRKLTEKDTWGATPIGQLWCRIQFRRAHYAGLYTPPSLGTTIAYPAFDGVVDWYGATLDPVNHLLIANASYIPFTMESMPTAEAMRRGLIKPWAGWNSNAPYPKPKEFAVAPQYGTPYAAVVKPWLTPLDVPCSAPPWGKLVAIDLKSRRIAWEEPVGTTRDSNLFNTHANVALPTGIFMIGGNIVTGSGLIFMAATADTYLRAFDERTGTELWRARLPAGGQATPMTYMGADGRQYIVIAAGGHGGLRTAPGDSIVAYALPGGP